MSGSIAPSRPTHSATPAMPAGLWLAAGLALLLALRLLAVWGSGAGLHVDEAQYWVWSRTLDWGYYSKPPGIAALIAASTALFGDSVLGVRALAILSWILSTALLYALGRRMDGKPGTGACAALLFAASPGAAVLGLVATTDAPLLLCWSAAMLASWQALHGPDATARWRAWCAAGLLLGLGLMSKYTMAALPLAWAWLAACQPRGAPRREAWRGLAAALGLGALLLLPNLLWNASLGWPTLQHTAAITVGAVDRGDGHALAQLAAYLLGVALLAGPLALWAAWRGTRQRTEPGPDARRFALAFTLPLLLLGLLLAPHRAPQPNWVAPVLPGLCLWLALRLDVHALKRIAWAALACTALWTALSAAGDLRRWLPEGFAPRAAHLDLWKRMRGWDEALAQLQPAVAAAGPRLVVANSRNLLAHGPYAWRGLPLDWRSWNPQPEHWRHHFDMVAPLTAATAAATPLWLLTEGAPEPALLQRFATTRRIASASSDRVRLELWEAEGPIKPLENEAAAR